MNTAMTSQRNTQPKASSQERSVPKFLRKVYYMLENNQHNDLVSWSPDGAALVVKKPTEFAEEVLPCYFKHNNFASFVRQLNMYNFKKKKNYQYDHAYGHEMFQKGKIELLRFIQRKSVDVGQVTLPKIELTREKEEDNSKTDIESLLQENLHYKRVQKTMITQFQFVEKKVKDIKAEINSLYEEFHKQEAKEEFLKKIIKKLSERFGSNSIQFAIEQAVQESSTPTLDMIKPVNALNAFSHLSESFEVSKRAELFSYNEGVSKNAMDLYSKPEVLTNDCSEFQMAEERLITNNCGYTQQESDDRSKSDSYEGWYAGFERKMYNPNQFLDVSKTSYRRSVLDGGFDDFDMLAGTDF